MTDLPTQEISEDAVEMLARRAWRRRHSITWESGADEDRQGFLTAARLDLAALVASGWRPEADVLRAYADRWHYVDHSRWPMSTFGAAPTPYCACGKTWPEGGCTERRNLIADASTFHEPDEPVADVIAAFGSGEKGVTKRPTTQGQERSEGDDGEVPNG